MNKYTKEIMDLLKENFKQIVGNKKFQTASEARSYYLVDLADNLCEPMGTEALTAYGKGAGNEIASGKMNALRSSSALTYNLLANNPAKIENQTASARIGNGTYSVEFEKQYRTLKPSASGKPANLDAFLYCTKSGEAIACEMKMMEWIFNEPGKLRKAYLKPENYINEEAGKVFVKIAKKLIVPEFRNADLEEYPCKMDSYDAFQMFKHAVACYRACACKKAEPRNINKLTLVNCVWTLSTPKVFDLNYCEKYLNDEYKELLEFKKFKDAMEPAKKIFKDIGVDFDIRFYTFKDFLALLNKSEDELSYLKRYTFE